MRHRILTFLALLLLFPESGFAQGPAGSRDAAVNAAWQRICASYCGGLPGSIRERGEGALLVLINNQTRYMIFGVTGGAGHWTVRMSPTAGNGQQPPSCLEGVVTGCRPAPQVDAAGRVGAATLVAGSWRRTAGNLAQQNVPTESITFDATTGNGRIRYKNGAERNLHLAAIAADGELHYLERAPVWVPIEYRCRVEGNRLRCQGIFTDSNETFPMTFFRHRGALPALSGTEFPFDPAAVPPG
jgi:hypothetical protein